MKLIVPPVQGLQGKGATHSIDSIDRLPNEHHLHDTSRLVKRSLLLVLHSDRNPVQARPPRWLCTAVSASVSPATPGSGCTKEPCKSTGLPFCPVPFVRCRSVSYTHLRAHETLMNL
eukprot:5344723-Prymnesium_polylepis.1